MSNPVIANSLPDTTVVALSAGNAQWRADLDPSAGGSGEHPTPHELLDSALAACTTLTIQLYAKRKQYPLAAVRVEIEREEDASSYRMTRRVAVEGDLSEAQRTDLLRVANACPIHKALHKTFDIATDLQPAGGAA
jgi:putative redox protein